MHRNVLLKKYIRNRCYFIIVTLKTEVHMAEIFVYFRPPEGKVLEIPTAISV